MMRAASSVTRIVSTRAAVAAQLVGVGGVVVMVVVYGPGVCWFRAATRMS